MTDWNPSDPDAPKVFYDLSGWDWEQQAELSSALADSEIPHTWDGTELVIPADAERETDAVFADLEQRLGITGTPPVDDATDEAADDEAADDEAADDATDGGATEHDASDQAREHRVLTDGEAMTDYDLTEWADLERSLVTESLELANIPFRFTDGVLSVPTADEGTIDEILDEVESGEMIPVLQDGPEGDVLPFESLNSFFLAGERLRKDPGDADGLERLLEAINIADPNRPPRGVELRVWRRSCELAEELADALIDGTETADDEIDEDGDLTARPPASVSIAEALHDLLRPLI